MVEYETTLFGQYRECGLQITKFSLDPVFTATNLAYLSCQVAILMLKFKYLLSQSLISLFRIKRAMLGQIK